MSTAAEPQSRPRGDAATRRQDVLDAAVAEFAQHGFHGASTPAIARRAWISQPYIYALFPSKKALFTAAHTRVIERIRDRDVEHVLAAGGGVAAAAGLRFGGGGHSPTYRSINKLRQAG